MAEKDVAKKLADKSPRLLWEPISDKYGVGTPDRCVMVRGLGRVLWVELKHLYGLPIRSCKIGLKPNQAKWLDRWKRNGGECYVIVGIGNDKVCIFDNGFLDICRHGVVRENFVLMNYNEVERYFLDGKASSS